MKRLEMTEKLFADALTISADKQYISQSVSPIMPSTHIKEFDKQCRSNVDTRQMVNETVFVNDTTISVKE